MTYTKELSVELIRSLFTLDPETGGLFWRISPGRNGVLVGDPAGCQDAKGRFSICIKGEAYKKARIVWCHFYGSWPTSFVDHIDGNPANDRIANLRDVCHKQNSQNMRKAYASNKSTGLLGVTACGGRYRAKIKADGVYHSLGRFDTPEEAHSAYVAAKRRLHAGCTL